MRILLTGVTGQVGRALWQPLAEFGTVAAADRATLDLSQPASIAQALDEIQPQLIVNPAAYTAVDLAEDERDLAFRINAEAPAALAAWAAARGVPLVHFSTDYVFDGRGETPWREADEPSPLSVYGASKLAGERAIAQTGCPHLIVRTSWVYAADGKNFLRTIARLAGEREELRIVADQFGAPTSARIIAAAVTGILRKQLAGEAPFVADGGIVNVTAAGVTSWHGFATAIVEGLKARDVPVVVQRVMPIATSEFPTKARRPLNSRLDHGRLNATFAVTMPDWQSALGEELDDFVTVVAA